MSFDAGTLMAAVQLVAGDQHTCVVRGTTAKCWGDNQFGESGAPITAGNPVPNPTTLATDAGVVFAVQTIAAGGGHTCFVDTTGRLKCLGRADEGQLGLPDAGTSRYAREVSDGGWSRVVASYRSTCALSAAGEVWCFGDNPNGQLGFSGPTPVPMKVPGLSNIVALRLSQGFGCAVDASGAVWCFGDNGFGQLARPGAGVAPGLASFSAPEQLALGYLHGCAIFAGGELRCWGSNQSGALGYDAGTQGFSSVPQIAAGLSSGVIGLATGSTHTCAVLSDGGVRCWGQNSSLQVGATGSGIQNPVDVMMPEPAVAVTAGANHTCAQSADGGVWCWGANFARQLGPDTSQQMTATPVQITGL